MSLPIKCWHYCFSLSRTFFKKSKSSNCVKRVELCLKLDPREKQIRVKNVKEGGKIRKSLPAAQGGRETTVQGVRLATHITALSAVLSGTSWEIGGWMDRDCLITGPQSHPQPPNPKSSERREGLFVTHSVTNLPWTDERLFIVFMPLGVNIHGFGCRHTNVFDYGVLPQDPLGC